MDEKKEPSFHLRIKNLLNNGSNLAHPRQRRQSLFRKLERLWPRVFGC